MYYWSGLALSAYASTRTSSDKAGVTRSRLVESTRGKTCTHGSEVRAAAFIVFCWIPTLPV
jgi:hypothetical protein